nr:MAG TPA: hypothetical protein [Caudoviricetes sp.]
MQNSLVFMIAKEKSSVECRQQIRICRCIGSVAGEGSSRANELRSSRDGVQDNGGEND